MRKEGRAIEEIRKILKKNEATLKEKFKVKEIGIFGSFVRGEDRKKSDIDILVETGEQISLLKFIALERYLSKLVGRKLDLVDKTALKPRIGKHILEEVKYI